MIENRSVLASWTLRQLVTDFVERRSFVGWARAGHVMEVREESRRLRLAPWLQTFARRNVTRARARTKSERGRNHDGVPEASHPRRSAWFHADRASHRR